MYADVVSTVETLGRPGLRVVTERCLLGMVRQYLALAMHERELRAILEPQRLRTMLSLSFGQQRLRD